MSRITIESAEMALASVPEQFVSLFRHGSLEVEYYRPEQIDRQNPHTRDEIYVVTSGSGYFVNGRDRHPFTAGDVLFAAADVTHRFEDFTPDFATWVFFYGPDGGESDS